MGKGHLFSIADAPEDDGTPGVGPRGELMGGVFEDLVKGKCLVEDEVILGECLLTMVVERRCFTKGLVAAGKLGGSFVGVVSCLVAGLPDLGDMVPEQSGDSQDPR